MPFGLEHAYTTSMGYTNVEGWAQYFREADAWALVMAGIGVLLAAYLRSRFGIAADHFGHRLGRSPPPSTRKAASTTSGCSRCGSSPCT